MASASSLVSLRTGGSSFLLRDHLFWWWCNCIPLGKDWDNTEWVHFQLPLWLCKEVLDQRSAAFVICNTGLPKDLRWDIWLCLHIRMTARLTDLLGYRIILSWHQMLLPRLLVHEFVKVDVIIDLLMVGKCSMLGSLCSTTVSTKRSHPSSGVPSSCPLLHHDCSISLFLLLFMLSNCLLLNAHDSWNLFQSFCILCWLVDHSSISSHWLIIIGIITLLVRFLRRIAPPTYVKHILIITDRFGRLCREPIFDALPLHNLIELIGTIESISILPCLHHLLVTHRYQIVAWQLMLDKVGNLVSLKAFGCWLTIRVLLWFLRLTMSSGQGSLIFEHLIFKVHLFLNPASQLAELFWPIFIRRSPFLTSFLSLSLLLSQFGLPLLLLDSLPRKLVSLLFESCL